MFVKISCVLFMCLSLAVLIPPSSQSTTTSSLLLATADVLGVLKTATEFKAALIERVNERLGSLLSKLRSLINWLINNVYYNIKGYVGTAFESTLSIIELGLNSVSKLIQIKNAGLSALLPSGAVSATRNNALTDSSAFDSQQSNTSPWNNRRYYR